jgi:uncharacterized protein (TIGR02145 family)
MLFIVVPAFLKAQVVLSVPDGAVLATTDGNILTARCGFFTVVDVDGHIYNTVEIGTQCWLGKNLATTRYNDGTTLPNVTDAVAWRNLINAAYCDYSNTPSYSVTYGRLYNWYSVDNNASTKFASNGGKNICPTGWHVPTDVEWTTLTTFLGGVGVSGGKLKEAGTTHWLSPNTGATNETGFTSLPSGYRDSFSAWNSSGYIDFWWSVSEASTSNAWGRYVHKDVTSAGTASYNKLGGLSVRCLQDPN